MYTEFCMSVYTVSLLLATLSCYVLHCLGKVLSNRNWYIQVMFFLIEIGAIAMAHPVVKASLVDASEISYLIAFSPLKLKVKTGKMIFMHIARPDQWLIQGYEKGVGWV